MFVMRAFVTWKLIAAIALIASCFPVSHSLGGVTIAGDATGMTASGLQRIGNSMNAQVNADTLGSGFAYDIYVGGYTVSASDILSGTGFVGNTGKAAVGAAFDVGDEIFIIGWKSTLTGTDGKCIESTDDDFLVLDPNGNAGCMEACAPDGTVAGVDNSDPGNAQLQGSGNFGGGNSGGGNSGGGNSGGGNFGNAIFPVLTSSVLASAFIKPGAHQPIPAFGGNTSGLGANGQPETLAATSQTPPPSVTELGGNSVGGSSASGGGQGPPFYTPPVSGSGGTGEVIPAGLPVPEPASISLLLAGAGILSLARRRKRRSS